MADDEAREWLGLAEDDLRQVVNNLEGPLPSPSGAAYHCQQAVEKLTKAVLVALDIDFPRSHDIGALVDLLPMAHPLRLALDPFRSLTAYAVAFRYPAEDERDIPQARELDELRERIQAAVAAVRSQLGL